MNKAVNIGNRVVPGLLVSDMEETLNFYQGLGFQVTGQSPDGPPPTWAEVTRDGVVMQFHTEAPIETPPRPVCSATFYLYPESVLRLAEEFRGRVEFAWGPEEMEYGMREFGIRDPNGYFLAFAEPVL